MGSLTLPPDGLIYLDTAIVIYSVEKIEPYWSLLEPMWLAAQTGNFTLFGSELLVLETLVKPLQENDTQLTEIYRQLLLESAEIHLLPINLAIIEQAAQLRATYKLKTPDALHAATAMAAYCNLFLTNDKGFRQITELSISLLRDFVVD